MKEKLLELPFHPSAFKSFLLAYWCRGEDSNLRRALARRVYSPVPLTTRPPLPVLSKLCSRRQSLLHLYTATQFGQLQNGHFS